MTTSMATENRCRGCGEPTNTFCDTCATVPVFLGYSRMVLRREFDRVQNPTNWKLPIDTWLPVVLKNSEQRVIEAAVLFYAGCVPTFIFERRRTHVKAACYYAAVGA